ETAAVLLRLALGPRGAQYQQQRSVELALHVGDLGLRHLETADGLTKCLAVTRPLQSGFISGARNADGLRRDADAPRVQHTHGDLEPGAFLTQQIGRRT